MTFYNDENPAAVETVAVTNIGDALPYTPGDTDQYRSEVGSTGGQFTATANDPDYEFKTTYRVADTATDPCNAFDPVAVTVELNNVDVVGAMSPTTRQVGVTLGCQWRREIGPMGRRKLLQLTAVGGAEWRRYRNRRSRRRCRRFFVGFV